MFVGEFDDEDSRVVVEGVECCAWYGPVDRSERMCGPFVPEDHAVSQVGAAGGLSKALRESAGDGLALNGQARF